MRSFMLAFCLFSMAGSPSFSQEAHHYKGPDEHGLYSGRSAGFDALSGKKKKSKTSSSLMADFPGGPGENFCRRHIEECGW